MNAPENCGRAPPQACAGGAFGPQAKPSPAGDGFSGLRPLAPAAPGRPAARPSPCGNSAFIPNTFRIIQSNLYSFRQISRPLPFGGPASLAKARIHRAKSMQGASLGNGSSPTPPQALCLANESGRSPSGLSYTYCILLSNYTSIRRNPPRFCDHKCHVPFPRCQNSAEQFSERKSKITSSTMVYAWKKRGHPTVGRAYPLGSSKAGLYDTSRDTNLPSLPHFPLRPFRRPQTPYQDKMPFPVILRRPSPHPPPAALCRPASVIPRHGGAAGPPPAPH